MGLPATIAAAGSVYLGWLNLRKIDRNTELTKVGSEAATKNTRVVVSATNIAIQKADDLSQKTDALNDTLMEKIYGSLDDRIRTIVREYTDPLALAFQAHAEQDDKNMREIRVALGELRDRMPK
jgi:hypothetical protein